MTDSLKSLQDAARPAALCGWLFMAFWSASCSSSKIKGVPDRLPDIALSGSAATPAHHMATYEYPFDSNGNYVGDWAAEGEHRAGRSAIATSDDEKTWSGSHGGRSASKSTSKAPSTAKSKSTGSSKYVVKKGDTVERIARRYGISVAKLKAANGLKSNVIRAGQTLKIPR